MLYRLPTNERPSTRPIYTDTNWRLLISGANSAYGHRDKERARALYEDAFAEACLLYDAAYSEDVEAPVAVLYVISCHNRADLARIEGDLVQARQYARDAFERLVGTAEDPLAPLKLRKGAVQNLGKALSYIAELGHAHANAGKELEERVLRARRAALSVFKVSEHDEHARKNCGHCDVIQ